MGHTPVVVLIQADETIYQSRVHEFVGWCRSNFLQLNVKKTKEMVIDFRTSARTHQHILVDGDEVEIVEECKYLGVTTDSRLTWSTNTDDICKS